eukprot:3641633-Alexandrium_andersonii.AAC.1
MRPTARNGQGARGARRRRPGATRCGPCPRNPRERGSAGRRTRRPRARPGRRRQTARAAARAGRRSRLRTQARAHARTHANARARTLLHRTAVQAQEHR